MRTMMVLALGLCCAQPVVALAATFPIDSSQSFISVETPTWQRGAPWGVILPGENESGVTTVLGYEWLSVAETQYFALSGNLDVTPITHPYLGEPQLKIDLAQLVASVPAELGFQLPGSISIDSTGGELRWNNSCSGSSSSFPSWCYQPSRYEWLTATLSDNNLKIDGEAQGLRLFDLVYFGGLDAPPLPEYSLSELGYAYHIVATIPEPSSALMLTAGVAAILLRRSRRDRLSS